MQLTDQRGRQKHKLRISLTDRCNFRCPYCMPEDPHWLPRQQLLSFEELQRLCKLFVSHLGIKQIRLTGGEPLLRNDIDQCISAINQLRDQGLERISLTTNGILLPRLADRLKAAGVDDINISLDSLDPERFLRLSGGRSHPDDVIRGIHAAVAAGLAVKLNTVVIKDYNDEEILPLVQWAMSQNLPLRFIEFMPLDGNGNWSRDKVVSEEEILHTLRSEYSLQQAPATQEPATYYRLDEHYRLGIIPTISNPFCQSCNRLRLTATGELYACLFSAKGRDLREGLRSGLSDEEIEAIIRGHVWHKEEGYAVSQGYVERPITMHTLGG